MHHGQPMNDVEQPLQLQLQGPSTRGRSRSPVPAASVSVISTANGGSNINDTSGTNNSATTKKKGRFVITKTATASTARPNNRPQDPDSGVDEVVAPSKENGKDGTQVDGISVEGSVGSGSLGLEDKRESAGTANVSTAEVAPHLSNNNDNLLDARPLEITNLSMKKKGRFIVKTGVNAVISSTSEHLEATVHPSMVTTPHVSPKAYSTQQFENAHSKTVQSSYLSGNNVHALTPGVQPTHSITGSVDVISHNRGLSVPNATAPNVFLTQASQPIPPRPILTSSVSAETANMGQTPQLSAPHPTDMQTQDSPPPPIPLLPTTEVPKQKKTVSAASFIPAPKSNHSAEGVGSHRFGTGRLLGTGGGVGKILHYLDSVRLEVIEADRSLLSLQADNRILRDKNKELEAKITKLERQLEDEKLKNKKLQQKMKLLSEDPHAVVVVENGALNNHQPANSTVQGSSSNPNVTRWPLVKEASDFVDPSKSFSDVQQSTHAPTSLCSTIESTFVKNPDQAQIVAEITPSKQTKCNRNLMSQKSVKVSPMSASSKDGLYIRDVDIFQSGINNFQAKNPALPTVQSSSSLMVSNGAHTADTGILTQHAHCHTSDAATMMGNAKVSDFVSENATIGTCQPSLYSYNSYFSQSTKELSATSQSPPPPPSNCNNRNSPHFDPMGTPKRFSKVMEMDTTTNHLSQSNQHPSFSSFCFNPIVSGEASLAKSGRITTAAQQTHHIVSCQDVTYFCPSRTQKDGSG